MVMRAEDLDPGTVEKGETDDHEHSDTYGIAGINLKQPGWQITLNFEGLNTNQEVNDLNVLRELVVFGFAELDEEDPRKPVLYHLAGCAEEKIPKKYIGIIYKYNPDVVTSKDSDLPTTIKAPPVPTVSPPKSSRLPDLMAESVRAAAKAYIGEISIRESEIIDPNDRIVIYLPFDADKHTIINRKMNAEHDRALRNKILNIVNEEDLFLKSSADAAQQRYVIEIGPKPGQADKQIQNPEHMMFLVRLQIIAAEVF